MKIILSKSSGVDSGILIVATSLGALKKHPAIKRLAPSDRDFIIAAVKTEDVWTPKHSLSLLLPLSPAKRVIIMGSVEKAKRTPYTVELEARRALALLKQHRIKNASLWLSDFTAPQEKIAGAMTKMIIALRMADYTYNRYKKVPKGGWPSVVSLSIVLDNVTMPLRRAHGEGEIIAEGINACRDLSNTPGGDMTPDTLAGAALAVAEETKGLSITVIEEKELKKLGMGGVLGVSKGSSENPCFIIFEYKAGKKTQKPLVFIGKGVTFDTGGLNLKPRASINGMHMDMSGGAAVIEALSVIAKLKFKVNVIGLIPAVENMPSGSSYRPGDVLTTLGGKTIEIGNTDAEGRVILADALEYAKRYKPKLVVDVATLTGAVMVALGQRVNGLFTNDEKLEKLGRAIGNISGDRAWPLPVWDEYLPDILGTFGDLNNTGKTRYGGSITAALFLKQFTDYPWMHIDITPRMVSISGDHLSPGAVGAGVRFLVELARRHTA